LTTETRWPARFRWPINCSTRVVLPEPEYPQNPITFIAAFVMASEPSQMKALKCMRAPGGRDDPLPIMRA